VFEAVVVKIHYGTIKEVGNRSLPELAQWKATAEPQPEAET
jgi:hypothetical protein